MTVTIGGLFFKFAVLEALTFFIISSAFSSLIGLCPNSLTKNSAVSAANVWFMVTVTPIPKRYLITLLDCSAIRLANSLTVIASGILISLFTGLRLSLSLSLLRDLFSFSLALLTDAKLLSLASISSLKALETVSLTSLFLLPVLSFLSSLILGSDFNLFVALCSASFRFSKSFGLIWVLVENLGLFVLNEPPF